MSYQCRKLNCHSFKHQIDNSSQTIYPNKSTSASNVTLKSFVTEINSQLIFGRAILIDHSKSVLEVLQPNNDNEGCNKRLLSRPSHTGEAADNCEIVVNAGLFDTVSSECYGNVINRGKVYQNSGGIRNAHFGLRKDGGVFLGYLSEDEVSGGLFDSLVGGAVWLLRDGESVVDRSIAEECAGVQETDPSLAGFANIRSARSAIGAFANGTVIIVQVNGKSYKGGLSLYELATLMAHMGVVAAINLDGGGSSTVVVNRTVVSYPSDVCDSLFTCERKVTTVICVRARCRVPCLPLHSCVHGFCELSATSPSSSKSILVYLIVLTLILLCLSLPILVFICCKLKKRRRTSRADSDNIYRQPLMFTDIDL